MGKKPRDRIVRESMVFYRGWAEGIEDLDEKDQLEAFWNLIRYGLDGTEPTNKGPARSVFRVAKPQIDANNARYQNSLKGGRRSNQMQPGDNISSIEESLWFCNVKTKLKFFKIFC